VLGSLIIGAANTVNGAEMTQSRFDLFGLISFINDKADPRPTAERD
jgi:hypothetical protein